MTEKEHKINYFVGPYGSGKTSLITQLRKKSKHIWHICLEDEPMIAFLKNPDVKDRQSFYLNVSFYKLKKAIDDFCRSYSVYKELRGILFDGHPLLGLIYARTFFELEQGATISYPEWGILNRQHTRLYKYVLKEGLLDNFKQTIYYINLPFDENWFNILERNRLDTDEIDEWYLENLRRILHQEIYGLADYYHCELIELKSMKELNELTL